MIVVEFMIIVIEEYPEDGLVVHQNWLFILGMDDRIKRLNVEIQWVHVIAMLVNVIKLLLIVLQIIDRVINLVFSLKQVQNYIESAILKIPFDRVNINETFSFSGYT